ncbi:MAG TPA: lytic transglycosylase domain-containing protein [Solirubrobacteraceae bacterium]|nr:lytic transglycosylase domain-containing protein [Solirubrobacteraceae bacterium]
MKASSSLSASQGVGHRVVYRAGSRSRVRHGGPGPRGGRLSGAGLALAAVVAAGVLAVTLGPDLDHTVRRLALPLSDEQVIREQAAAKHLDPALIAAVIYAETKFDPRTSPAGAEGLMQILPSTAQFLAHLSGGVRFTTSDLGTPAINVAYGSYYLRYLLDHYGGDETLAVAAYNAGLANVDRWVARAGAEGKRLQVAEIPFAETRAYVQRVLQAQQEYRSLYAHQLGIG